MVIARSQGSMARRLRSVDLATHIQRRPDAAVTLQGWLHVARKMGKVAFLVLRDGWGMVQIVLDDAQALAEWEALAVMPESVLQVEGRVVANAQAPNGLEVVNPRIDVLNPVQEPLPVLISKREIAANLTNMLDHAVTVNRHPSRRAVFRMAAVAMKAFRRSMRELGFTEIQSPKLVASATESGANVFPVTYFDRQAYLAQSPQFYKQIMVGVFERVFEVGPVFRAEPHDTVRHTNEYVSLDAEMGFIEDHRTVMAVLRMALAGIVSAIGTECEAELHLLQATLPDAPELIPSIDFRAAQELLYERHGLDVRGEPDLSPQDERLLGEWARQEHGSDFLFVTGYPMAKRPFHTHPDPARPDQSNSFDLIFRGTELVTGGQRLHRYQDYLEALARVGQSPEPLAGYLEAFRYGMPPHGGFAIGLERLLMQLLGLPNVRLATLFPRDLTRLTP